MSEMDDFCDIFGGLLMSLLDGTLTCSWIPRNCGSLWVAIKDSADRYGGYLAVCRGPRNNVKTQSQTLETNTLRLRLRKIFTSGYHAVFSRVRNQR